MSSNTNIGNTPVNQGYVQLIHTGETGGIDGTLRTLYDGDGTAADLLIASDKVKVSTELFIGAKTLTEFIQDTVGTMFTTGNSLTNVSVTYDDANNNIDLNATGEVTLTGSQTLTNKTLTSPVINTSVSGTAILDEDNMSSNSDSKLATQQSIKAYVDAEVSSLVSSAPTALDTLDELAAALGDDANFATTTATSLGEKLVKASNLSDLTNTTTARSNLGLGSLAELSSIAVSNLTASAIQTSGESFADNDTSLMTSAAIQDKIESFGYTTNTGDMTGVSITASNPLDISQSNTTSGSYSATISLVASEFGGYLADMTDLVVGGTDELAVLDNGTLKRKQIDEIRLTAFDATGFTAGTITSATNMSNNRILTASGSTTINGEANFTIDGTSLQLGDSKILSLGNSDDLQIHHTSNQNRIDLNNGNLTFRDDGDNNIFIIYREGGGIQLSEGDLKIPATSKLYLDGGSNTYITESSADRVKIFVGGDEMLNLIESSTNVVRVEDETYLGVGNSTDLFMYHSSGNSFINNGTGNLTIRNQTDDGDIIFQSDDGSGGQTAYITLDGSATTINVAKNMDFADNVNARFGSSSDMNIVHDSSDTFIDNYTGDLKIRNNANDKDVILLSDDGAGGTTAYLTLDGSTTDLLLSPPGNIGIGTTSPGALFTVRKDGTQASSVSTTYQIQTVSDSNGGIAIQAGGTSSAYLVFGDNANYDAGRIQYNNSNNKMNFQTAETTAMSIDSSQNVGIGTTSPSAKLDIDSTSGTALYVDGGVGGANIAEFHRTSGATASVKIHAGGGDPQITYADTDRTFSMRIDASENHFKIAEHTDLGSNERFRIADSGNIIMFNNVGIGTSSPYERLYVECEDDTSPGIVSNPASTNGAVAYAIGYGDANRDYLCTWGMDHSSGGNVFGYGVKPDGSTSEAFINSADNSNFKRGALYFDDELKFFNASAQTGTIDTAITMTERFRVDADGDGFFDRDVVAFSTTVSDCRLKDNIETIPNALDKVMSLRGVEFDWNATSRKGQHDIGLIAQEVQEVLPEVVIDKKLCMGDMKNNEKDYKTVDYEKIVGVLVEAIKELKQEIEELKK